MEDIMEDLVRHVASHAGISESEAFLAVQTTVHYLKNKLPAPVATQLDGLLGNFVPRVNGNDSSARLRFFLNSDQPS